MKREGASGEAGEPDDHSSGELARAGGGLEAAVAKIYAASVEAELWPSALRRVAGLLGPARVSMYAETLKTKVVNLIGAAADRDVLPAVAEGPAGVHGNLAMPAPIGRAVVTDQGDMHVLAVCLLRDDEIAITIMVERPGRAPEFGRRDIECVERLVPHLQRALRTQRHLADAELRWHQATDVLDRLAAGLILLDGSGRVLFANRYALDLLDARTGLAIIDELLQAVDDDAHARLRSAITRVAASKAGGRGSAGDALLLPRGSPGKPLTALVAPLRTQPGWLARITPAAAVFVTDPDRGADTPDAVLMELYGLTKAEAALATVLLTGQGLPRAAARLKISLNTAKTHLKRIFDKTGTRQQAELIRLILTGPGSVRLK